MEYLDLSPIHRVTGSVNLPGSKSISNRLLLLAALAEGVTHITHLLHSDDTARMLEALTMLGVTHRRVDTDTYHVNGTQGNFPVKKANLFLGNAGTAFRSLTGTLAFMQGNYQLSGIARMHERPIGDLVNTLTAIGANITYLERPGFPPLHIQPSHCVINGPIPIRGNVSSQFLTALLLALPLLKQPVTLKVIGELISKPYIGITLDLMQRFGVTVINENWQYFHLSGQDHYHSPGIIQVEGDASSASYFLAAGAIAGGEITVQGVGKKSIQGDKYFADTLAQMGAQITWADNSIRAAPPRVGKLRALDVDLNAIPDAAMTLAVTALFAEGTTTIRNIASWRVKETDRIAAMATELRKVGAIVEEGMDYIRITPPTTLLSHAIIDTYDDHRMAMCLSLVALGGVPIRIHDPHCVAKTFPDYFDVLAGLTMGV
jgi:3-phosphoshikimate 1-carboxyvinyltransferase